MSCHVVVKSDARKWDDRNLVMSWWRTNDGRYHPANFAMMIAWDSGCIGRLHRAYLAIAIIDLYRASPSTCCGLGAARHIRVVGEAEKYLIHWESGYRDLADPAPIGAWAVGGTREVRHAVMHQEVALGSVAA